MPRLTFAISKHSHHKASGQAVVTLAGRDHYLGPHGTKASRLEYDRLIAEWIAAGRPSNGSFDPNDFTVVAIIHSERCLAGSTQTMAKCSPPIL